MKKENQKLPWRLAASVVLYNFPLTRPLMLIGIFSSIVVRDVWYKIRYGVDMDER